MSRDLGFSSKVGELDVSDFKPQTSFDPQIDSSEQKAADSAAERAGFITREPVERVRRKRGRKKGEPTDHAYVRAPVTVLNRFKQYCNDTDQSYGEAIATLLENSGIYS